MYNVLFLSLRKQPECVILSTRAFVFVFSPGEVRTAWLTLHYYTLRGTLNQENLLAS